MTRRPASCRPTQISPEPRAILFSLLAALAVADSTRAETICRGIVAVEYTKTTSGALSPIVETCYEPGTLRYLDAPGIGRPDPFELSRPAQDSVTHFEATEINALSAIPLNELINPIPPGLRPQPVQPPK